MDWSTIVVAVIGCIGSCLGSLSGLKVVTYRIEQLEKKVDRHNNFAERVPVIEEKIKVCEHRISDLEEK